MTEAKAPAVVVDTTEFQPDLLLSKGAGIKPCQAGVASPEPPAVRDRTCSIPR